MFEMIERQINRVEFGSIERNAFKKWNFKISLRLDYIYYVSERILQIYLLIFNQKLYVLYFDPFIFDLFQKINFMYT